jgi:hypothetical protein
VISTKNQEIMGFSSVITSFCPYLPVLRGLFGLRKHATIRGDNPHCLRYSPTLLPLLRWRSGALAETVGGTSAF